MCYKMNNNEETKQLEDDYHKIQDNGHFLRKCDYMARNDSKNWLALDWPRSGPQGLQGMEDLSPSLHLAHSLCLSNKFKNSLFTRIFKDTNQKGKH